MRFFSRNQLEQAKKELLAWNPLLKIEKLGVNQDAGTAVVAVTSNDPSIAYWSFTNICIR